MLLAPAPQAGVSANSTTRAIPTTISILSYCEANYKSNPPSPPNNPGVHIEQVHSSGYPCVATGLFKNGRSQKYQKTTATAMCITITKAL